MPIERREISLHTHELMQAVASYARQTPGALPVGEILGVCPSQASSGRPSVVVSVMLSAEPDGPPIDVRLTYESVFELLIRFCREEGIPMPRSGKKEARVVGALLTLLIEQGGG
jgi:hypothetical protein